MGRYVIIGGEKEGVKEPDERIKGTTVTFTKETVVVADKDKKEIYSASYKLDATTNPCDITMTSRVDSSAGEIARGLDPKRRGVRSGSSTPYQPERFRLPSRPRKSS